jgi:uncharacterized protein (DUF433 family)
LSKINISNYIDLNPYRGGEPIYLHTKIRVSHIIDDLAKGMSFEEILKEHKELTYEHLQATFIYLQQILKDHNVWKVMALI